MNDPYYLLAAFGIVDATPGAVAFLELVWDIAADRDHGIEMPTQTYCARLWRRYKLHPRDYYAVIRRSLRPILDADEDQLRAAGLRPQKFTVPSLANAVASWMLSGSG